MKQTKSIVIIASVILVLALCIVYSARFRLPIGWDLRNNLWGPAFLLTHDGSPYAVNLLFDNSNAVWFPMLIGLLFPLGWLTQNQVAGIWMVGNVASLFIICWLVSGKPRPPLTTFALTAACVLVFPATITHLLQGQFTIIAMLLLWLVARDVNKNNFVFKGFVIAMALTKPQLSLLVLPGLVIAHARISGFKATLRFIGSTCLWIPLLLTPLWLVYPGWTADFIMALQRNQVSWAQPSLYSLLPLWLGTAGLLIWGMLASGGFVINIWVWLNRRPETAVLWSMALTTLVSPYIWSYDFVLLAPLAVHTAFWANTSTAKMIMGIGYAISWGATVWIRLSTDNSDSRFWWVTWLFIAVTCVAALTSRQESSNKRYGNAEILDHD